MYYLLIMEAQFGDKSHNREALHFSWISVKISQSNCSNTRSHHLHDNRKQDQSSAYNMAKAHFLKGLWTSPRQLTCFKIPILLSLRRQIIVMNLQGLRTQNFFHETIQGNRAGSLNHKKTLPVLLLLERKKESPDHLPRSTLRLVITEPLWESSSSSSSSSVFNCDPYDKKKTKQAHKKLKQQTWSTWHWL